jgi:hypothetical protein
VRRVALFDWTTGGHRPIYVRRFVEALGDSVDVVLAFPQATLDEVGKLDAEQISLGDARPPFGRRLLRRRAVLPEEVEKLRVVSARVDQAVHLSADHALFSLASAARLPSPLTLILYYMRAHYGASYGTPLPIADRAIAYGKSRAMRRWRRRPDALSVLTLDEALATQAKRNDGAPVHWLPEPPVASLPPSRVPSERRGCVLYGALAPRKGIDLLAAALCTTKTPVQLVLAGVVDPPDFASELTSLAQAMEQSGVEVDLRPRQHSEFDGLEVLASACCAVLPYRRHAGMSRVLVEAASVGTPVVADRFGLLGHLVRTHDLGLTVDAANPPALRSAVLELADPERAASYADALARFAARFTRERFRDALVRGLALDASLARITSTSTTSS